MTPSCPNLLLSTRSNMGKREKDFDLFEDDYATAAVRLGSIIHVYFDFT